MVRAAINAILNLTFREPMKHLRLSHFAVACLVAAAPVLTTAAESMQAPTPVTTSETRVYVGECLKTPGLPALRDSGSGELRSWALAPLTAIAAKVLVDTVATAIHAAAAVEAVAVDAAYPVTTHFYEPEGADKLKAVLMENTCVQVVSGQFTTTPAVSVQPEASSKVSWATLDESGTPSAALTGLDPALQKVRVVFQAKFVAFEGPAKAFSLKPVYFAFLAPAKSSFFDMGNTKRQLALTFTLRSKDQAEGTALANLTFPFMEVQSGTERTYEYFKKLDSKPFPFPKLNEAENAALATLKDKPVSLMQKLADAPLLLLEELTRQGGALAEFCASRDAYAQAMAKKFVPTKENKQYVGPDSDLCPALNLKLAGEMRDKRKGIEAALKSAGNPGNANKYLSGATTNCSQAEDCATTGKSTEKASPRCKERLPSGDCPFLQPISIAAALAETRNPSDFVAFLDKIASAASTPLKSAIDASVSGTGVENQAVDVGAYYVAKATADAAYIAWQAAAETAKSDQWVKVVTARNLANTAARKAGLPEPYDLSATN